MLSSTREIAPSCVENVDELIERQEKALVQLETKRAIVNDLISKGKQLLENPDKPKFLEGHVKRIVEDWKPLQLNLRREMMKSRRSRSASTSRLPLRIWRRDRRSSMTQRTLLKACTMPSRTTTMS